MGAVRELERLEWTLRLKSTLVSQMERLRKGSSKLKATRNASSLPYRCCSSVWLLRPVPTLAEAAASTNSHICCAINRPFSSDPLRPRPPLGLDIQRNGSAINESTQLKNVESLIAG